MKTKADIINNWLPRYTGRSIEEFGKFIILVNFKDYVVRFAETYNVPITGEDRAMQSASFDDITIINFGMGSPNAATIMDLLEAITPHAVLFLGKCGGLKKVNKVGDLILPIAAIRGDGTSDDYFQEKYQPCQHLRSKNLFLQLFEKMKEIIGRVLYLQPIEEFGNGTKILKNTFPL